ncbi:hypothetical protein VTJ04DRAFT_3249 [Mycothermus thermophilus]|uniref:uncharacterized protein n=1 Tax=Humicola insolens TaxID=85995 RepID=UPI0037448B20
MADDCSVGCYSAALSLTQWVMPARNNVMLPTGLKWHLATITHTQPLAPKPPVYKNPLPRHIPTEAPHDGCSQYFRMNPEKSKNAR